MRQSQKQNRSRGRGNRKGGGGGNNMNRVYDSAGPEGKVRGTPQQIIDKYLALARDAQTSGDRVAAENFLQHAEHYQRILIAAASEQEKARREAQANSGDDSDDASDDQDDRGNDRGGDNRGGENRGGENRSSESRGRNEGANTRSNGNGRDRSADRKPDSNAIEGMTTIDQDGQDDLIVATDEESAAPQRTPGRRSRKRRSEDSGDQPAAETAEN